MLNLSSPSDAASNLPEDVALEQVRSWLGRSCGIAYPDHKRPLLMQRLRRILGSFGFDGIADLARAIHLDARQDVQLAVMSAASTNHTYFFREPEVLEAFTRLVLPDIARRGQMRIWSAACSTGDEAYTIAILAAQTLGLESLSRLQILGTDISEPVVERAERAVYPARQFDQVDPLVLRTYFEPTGIEQFRVRAPVRSVCTFRRMNLKARPWPFTRSFHAVFCRNILYYFDREDQRATLEAIHAATEPGGWLITSVTESIRDLGTRWEPVASGIYRRGA
jgi:chemotaxis protein methyltransferase CheR